MRHNLAEMAPATRDAAYPVSASHLSIQRDANGGRRKSSLPAPARPLRKESAPVASRRYRPSLFSSFIVLASLAFALLLWLARRYPYFSWDLKITRALQKSSPSWLVVLLRAISWPGFPPQVFGVLTLMLLNLYRRGLKWEAVSVVFAMIGPGGLGTLVKFFVDRPRPSPELVRSVNPDLNHGHFSFAAGHVQADVAILGFWEFLNLTLYQDSLWRRLETLLYTAVIALAGPARIHAGEHWTSDVIGGYLLGSTWLALSIKFYRWGKTRFFVRPPTVPGQPGSEA